MQTRDYVMYLTWVLGQWLDYQTDWYGVGPNDALAAAQGWDTDAFLLS